MEPLNLDVEPWLETFMWNLYADISMWSFCQESSGIYQALTCSTKETLPATPRLNSIRIQQNFMLLSWMNFCNWISSLWCSTCARITELCQVMNRMSLSEPLWTNNIHQPYSQVILCICCIFAVDILLVSCVCPWCWKRCAHCKEHCKSAKCLMHLQNSKHFATKSTVA